MAKTATAATNLSDRPVRKRGTRQRGSGVFENLALTEALLSPPVVALKPVDSDLAVVVRAGGAVSPSSVSIKPPNFKHGELHLVGTSPYVQHKFSQKAQTMMEEKQRAGEQARKNRKRAARDFEEDYLQALHVSTEGWYGIPAPAFRNALISACRVAGFAMTKAKLSVFVTSDGLDKDDSTPLVKIIGDPRPHKSFARNETGVIDLRWRPMWDEWQVTLRLRWDGDQFSIDDIVNLVMRAGMQVGVGEGRPDSPNSNGLGWGLWSVAE